MVCVLTDFLFFLPLRQNYIPSMYNDLDASQQSLSSQAHNADSQSSMDSVSQSFIRWPAQPKTESEFKQPAPPAPINVSAAPPVVPDSEPPTEMEEKPLKVEEGEAIPG